MATRINWYGKQLEAQVSRRVGQVLRATGLQMVRDVQNSMTQTERQTTGTKRGKKEHRPSQPGHPPAPDTGALRSSIEMDDGDLESQGVVYVGATGLAPYMTYLELGTDDVEARPALRPALDRVAEPLQAALKGVLP